MRSWTTGEVAAGSKLANVVASTDAALTRASFDTESEDANFKNFMCAFLILNFARSAQRLTNVCRGTQT